MEILGIKSITTHEIDTDKRMNVCIDKFETLSIIVTDDPDKHIYFEHTEKPEAKTLIFGYNITSAITPHETFRASDINQTHSVHIEFNNGFVLDTGNRFSISELICSNLGQKYHNVVVSKSSLNTIFITIFIVTDEMLQFLSYYHFEEKWGYHPYPDTICDFGFVGGNQRGRIRYSFYAYLIAHKHVREMLSNLGKIYAYDNKRFTLVEDTQKVDLYRTKYRFLHNL